MNTPTTNQQAAPQQSAPTTSTDAGSQALPSYDERVASIFGPDASTNEGAAEQTNGATATPAEQPTDAEKAAAERRARLAEWKAKERERVDAQARHRESEDIRRRLADAEKRAKEAEERAARHIDPSKLDVDTYLSIAEQIEVPPDKIAGRIRELMSNPEAVARRAAAGALDPKLAPVTDEVRAIKAKLDALEARQEAEREQAEEHAAFQQFAGFTQANASAAPYAAAFLAKKGAQEFYKLAHSAAASVPEGAGPQAILDVIEEHLFDLASAIVPNGATTTQQRQAPPPPNPAAAKAHTTVSNTLAQGRASVVDDETDWSSLSFEERSARLFR